MVDILPQASLFLGIIPALIILYIGLKEFEGYYKDKTVFLTFVIGIIIGFIAAVTRVFTLPMAIISIIILAFFEQLFKTIVLNIGRLQLKKETTIYGLSLGLGFGAVFTPFLIIKANELLTSDATILSLLTIGSIGIILFHGATGAFVGYGIYSGKMINYLLIAIIIQIPFNLIMDANWVLLPNASTGLQIAIVIAPILYGGIIFWYVYKKVMPLILTKTKRKKRIKEPK